MQFASFAIACSLLASPVLAGRDLKQATAESCTAFRSVNLLDPFHKCGGWPGATCQSHAKAELRLRAAFSRINKQELCSEFTRFSVSKEVAQALAEVYLEALSKVDCDSQGFGCGYAVSEEDTFSSAYAEVFSRAVLDNGPFFVPCEADLKSVAVGFARAADDARSLACDSDRKRELSFISAFVSTATVAVVESLSRATARTCSTPESGSRCSLNLDDTPGVILQGGLPVNGATSGSGLVLHGPNVQPNPFIPPKKNPSSPGGIILQNPSGTGTTAGQVPPCSLSTYLDCCKNQLKCGGPFNLRLSPPFPPFAFPFTGSTKNLLFMNGSLQPTCLCP